MLMSMHSKDGHFSMAPAMDGSQLDWRPNNVAVFMFTLCGTDEGRISPKPGTALAIRSVRLPLSIS